MRKAFSTALSISLLLASCSACTAPAASPTGVNTPSSLISTAAPPCPSLNPSTDIRNAVGLLNQKQSTEAVKILKTLTGNSYALEDDKALASFLLASISGKDNAEQKRLEAINLYKGAFNHKLLGNFARLEAASIAKTLGNETEIVNCLAPALNRKEGSESESLSKAEAEILAQLFYRLGESHFRSEEYSRSNPVFLQLRKKFPGSKYAVGAAYYLGETALKAAQDSSGKDVAYKYFKEYLKRSPGGKFSPEAVKELQKMAGYGTTSDTTAENTEQSNSNIKLSQDDHNLMAYACYRHTLWKMALEEWSRANYRHILRPVCLARTGKKQEALDEFLSLAKVDTTNPLLMNVAEELSKPLTRAQALVLWKGLDKYPLKAKDEILWNIAKREASSANACYSKIVNNYPKSKHADSALWWLIWHHIENSYHSKGKVRAGHLNHAARLCVKGVQQYPDSELAPLYAFWSGKLHERTGHRQEAIKIYRTTFERYPSSYYGYRSKFRSIHLISLNKNKTTGGKSKVIPDRLWAIHPARKNPRLNWSWPEPPKLFSWRQIENAIGSLPSALAWLGCYDKALGLAPSSTPRNMRGWLMVKNGQVLRGLGLVAWKLKGKPVPSPFWNFAYPLAYAGDIDREARKHGVDPLLAHGLIRQESRYDPNARSRSNAMGLMQLLKGTAYGVAKHNGIKLASTNQIFEPSTNIKLGCAYLGYVLRGKQGNAMLAVASYNGGPNAVKRWVKKHSASGIKDMDYFVENIPYRETRGYVRKVFANYWTYETLYLKK